MLISYARVSILDQDPALQLAAARSRGRKGGRPQALTEADRQAVAAPLLDRNISINEVATRVGVASSALYQRFPGGRSGLGRTV
jgi:DNA invertase Pin-like site-specific DNA recombinase